jgi:hypothetical protein
MEKSLLQEYIGERKWADFEWCPICNYPCGISGVPLGTCAIVPDEIFKVLPFTVRILRYYCLCNSCIDILANRVALTTSICDLPLYINFTGYLDTKVLCRSLKDFKKYEHRLYINGSGDFSYLDTANNSVRRAIKDLMAGRSLKFDFS